MQADIYKKRYNRHIPALQLPGTFQKLFAC